MIPGLGGASRTGPLDHRNAPPGSTPSEPPRARPGPLSRPTPGGSSQARFEGRMGPPGRSRGEPGCSRGEAAPEAPGGANAKGPAPWRAGKRRRGACGWAPPGGREVSPPPGHMDGTALGELLPTAPVRRAALACDQGAARLAVRRLGASASVERSAGPSLHPPPRALAEPGLPAAARTGVGEAIGWRPSATGAARGSGRSWQGPSRSREPQRGGAGALLELRPLGAVVEGPEWPRRRLTSRCRRRRPRR